ncbi:MAG: GFA family protein [Gammaproteobacteria bacterium]
MNEVFEGNGSCLCGAIRFTASNTEKSIGACHCEMCRKWGGGPLIGAHCGSDVSFLGGEKISIYSSSDWAERGFCKLCGSHLFYRLKENMHHFIPAGLFEDQNQFVLERQSYIDKKPSYYSFSNSTHDMTEAEMLEKYRKS